MRHTPGRLEVVLVGRGVAPKDDNWLVVYVEERTTAVAVQFPDGAMVATRAGDGSHVPPGCRLKVAEAYPGMVAGQVLVSLQT